MKKVCFYGKTAVPDYTSREVSYAAYNFQKRFSIGKKGDFSDKHCFRVLFFSVVFLMFSARCCPAEKVDILLPGKEGDWEKAGSYLQEQFDAAGVTAEVIYSGDDAGKQKEDLLRLISEKPDLLLLAAADPADIEKTAEKAVRTGIPVIAFGRLVMSRKIPWCVTFDSRQAGEAAGTVSGRLAGSGPYPGCSLPGGIYLRQPGFRRNP